MGWPVHAITGDASGRQYLRVTLPKGQSPGTLVVMDYALNFSPSDVALEKETPEEQPFVNMTRCLSEKGLPVPVIYRDHPELGLLLMEDLGDRVFFDTVSGAKEQARLEWYGAAVDLLADLHKSMWPIPEGCIAGTKAFDYLLLRWELEHYREWGAETPGEKKLEPDDLAHLNSAFNDLASEILAMPQGFAHRDYQSKNLMIRGEAPAKNNLTIIDYQDALSGPRVYDLVALLNDSYIDLTADFKQSMVTRYAERASIDPDALTLEFHLVSVHRKLKDGARFIFFDREKGNPASLPYVEGSFRRANESLEALPGHTALKSALAPCGLPTSVPHRP